MIAVTGADESRSSVPLAPGAIPGLGHATHLFRTPVAFMNQCRDVGGIVEVRLGPARRYLVCRPKLVHQLLVDRSFDRAGPFMDTLRPLAGNGLFTAPRALHRMQRPLIQPAFTKDRVNKIYARAMADEVEVLTARWQEDQEIDVSPTMSALALRVLARALMPEIDPQESDRLCAHFNALLSGLFRRIAIPVDAIHRLPIPGRLSYDRGMAAVHRTAEDIVKATGAGADRGSSEGLLATMLASDADAAGLDGPVLTSRNLRDQVVTFMIAGSETTGATISWALLELARNQEVEARLQAEVDEVLSGRAAKPEDLPALDYTRQVIAETLRKDTPVWLSSRIATTDVVLDGRRFEAGSEFLISPYLIHHDPAYFPEPGRFDPDRFHQDRISNISRDAYFPFGAGNRKCIGETFALAEATISLASIVSAWKLHPISDRRVHPRARLTMIPHGFRTRLQRRR